MRKELEVVGGVKSLMHCRCQTVHSIPSHPATATIYMSMAPACWLGMFHFHRSLLWLCCHLSFLCHPTFSFPSSVLTNLAVWCEGGGGREVCWVLWGGGALSLPSQAERSTGSQAGRKTRLSPWSAIVYVMWLEAAKVTGGGLLGRPDPLLPVTLTMAAAEQACRWKKWKRSATFFFLFLQIVEYKLGPVASWLKTPRWDSPNGTTKLLPT